MSIAVLTASSCIVHDIYLSILLMPCTLPSLLFALLHFILVKILQSVGPSVITILQRRILQFQRTH